MTFLFLKAFMALGLLNLSTTQSIAKEFTILISTFFLARTSASIIEFISIASIHILSALHLSIFIRSISHHLTKFHHQTTTQTSTSFFTNFLISSQISSITLKSNHNHFFQANASPEIFKSTLIING
jgi:hypothetical protein